MVTIRSGTIEAGSMARSTMGPTQPRHAHISIHAHHEGFSITYPKPATGHVGLSMEWIGASQGR